MTADRIVPALNVAKNRRLGFGLRCKPPPGQQFAFQRGKEALAHGVVVGIANRPHRGPHACFTAAATERQSSVLGGLKWSSQHPDGGSCDARSKAAVGSVRAGALILTWSPAGSGMR